MTRIETGAFEQSGSSRPGRRQTVGPPECDRGRHRARPGRRRFRIQIEEHQTRPPRRCLLLRTRRSAGASQLDLSKGAVPGPLQTTIETVARANQRD